jgi:hypothetical protein
MERLEKKETKGRRKKKGGKSKDLYFESFHSKCLLYPSSLPL